MRIAYFTESSLPHVDGVSLTLARLFEFLAGRGVEFRVFSPFTPGLTVPWSDRAVRVASVPFPLYRAYRVSVPGLRGLGRAVAAFRPDLVHVAIPTPAGAWARRYARRAGIPAVATFHTDFVSYFRYYGAPRLERLGWWLLRRFYDGFAAVYAPSATAAGMLRGHGVANVRIWARGVDADLFSPARRDPALRCELGISAARPGLLFVSRIVREKDVADLVAAVRVLQTRGRAFRLIVVGDGPLRSALERQLPGACFAGARHGADLARWYASADVFVLPSTTETFGNVVLEAQAAALPAVVVDRGGPRDVIRPGETGLVARANDPTDLADRLEPLLRDADLRSRMGAAARQRALSMDWDSVNESLLVSYRALLQADRDGPRARDDSRREDAPVVPAAGKATRS
jgi:phosphatidylinositol alpha 1,6-mannosyltransferase